METDLPMPLSGMSRALLALGLALAVVPLTALCCLALGAAGIGTLESLLASSVVFLLTPSLIILLAVNGWGPCAPVHGAAMWLLRAAYFMLRLFQGTLRLEQLAPQRMLVEVNNLLLMKKLGRSGTRFSPERVLVLLPHCLQSHLCQKRLTFDPSVCERCGGCPVGELLEICSRAGLPLAIATGGTTARKAVVENRPALILAVACPRDLASGILDVYPIPVYGLLNRWPNGECFDTWVDTGLFRELVGTLTGS